MSEPKNELGYGDVDARPDAADPPEAPAAEPAVPPAKPAVMNGSGHSVGVNDEPAG